MTHIELPEGHYLVHVNYDPLPNSESMKKEWGRSSGVSFLFNESFVLNSSCHGLDRTPGEKIFYLHDVDLDMWGAEERIAWGLRQRNAVAVNGYRPAIPEEGLDFVRAHPELADFAVFGAFVLDDDYCRRVLHMKGFNGRVDFSHAMFDGSWRREEGRILFVSR